MFTGIVQTVGAVTERSGSILKVSGRIPKVKKGDSVAVNGVCLTVTALTAGPNRKLAFDVSRETLDRTALGALAKGARVNLETAARLGDPLGGHIVLGHVDGTGQLLSKTPKDAATVIYEFSVPQNLRKYLAPKGSVAVNGVSLTVVDIRDHSFTVAVVPFTEKNTNFGALQPKDLVNLEADILAKHVERLLSSWRDAGPGDDLFVKKSLAWDQIMGEEGYR